MKYLKCNTYTISRLLLSAMLLCGFLFSTLPAADIAPFSDLTPAQAAALIQEKGADPLFIILDVRTPEEFTANRIEGAQNVDVKALDFKEQVAKLNKDGVFLVYCRGGVRSVRAMNLMKELGFKQVYNLAGGLKNWQAEKLPIEGAPMPAAAAPPS